MGEIDYLFDRYVAEDDDDDGAVCKQCDATYLRWVETPNSWRLYDGDEPHRCKIENPFEDERNEQDHATVTPPKSTSNERVGKSNLPRPQTRKSKMSEAQETVHIVLRRKIGYGQEKVPVKAFDDRADARTHARNLNKSRVYQYAVMSVKKG